MNKQFHVHSVNQWVACRQESESMSSSLIDRLDTVHYKRTLSVYSLYSLLTRKQNRMMHTRTFVNVCVRARRISYRPAPASRHRPVAPLPELRRIVTRLDMPAPRRIDSAPSPRTPRHTVRTLNYHGAALVKLLCISPGLIDIFY